MVVEPAASVAYALPAPPGHWIANPIKVRALPSEPIPSHLLSPPLTTFHLLSPPLPSASPPLPLLAPLKCCAAVADATCTMCPAARAGATIWELASAPFDDVLPFRCAPGLLGSSAAVEAQQKTPLCGGACPIGYSCAAGTQQGTICPRGHYCPKGASAKLQSLWPLEHTSSHANPSTCPSAPPQAHRSPSPVPPAVSTQPTSLEWTAHASPARLAPHADWAASSRIYARQEPLRRSRGALSAPTAL